MDLNWIDVVIFVLFFTVTVRTSLYKSRKEETGEDFFLASRSLFWPLIGLSLIAANISTEHFVGMSGQGAGILAAFVFGMIVKRAPAAAGIAALILCVPIYGYCNLNMER